MMFALGGGGYGMQESDPGLGDKLAALKRKRGNLDDKVTAFLERDLGVDPLTLPFSDVQAREYVNSLIEDNEGSCIEFFATSMGLTSALISDSAMDSVAIGEQHPEWHDVNRAYTTLVKQFIDQRVYGFRVSLSFDPDLTFEPVPANPVRYRDATSYQSGSILRIEKHRVDGDQLVFDHLYIRIGGLFDDTTPTILDTMQPIPDLTGWSVTEEIS